MSGAAKHTILLLQTSSNQASRTFQDFPSVPLAMDALITRFEGELSRLNPTRPQLTYEVTDLASYIERMPDLSALVFEDSIQAYVPCGKEWIKAKAEQALRRTAERRR